MNSPRPKPKPKPIASGPTLGEVIDEYLAFVKAHKSPETHLSYRRYAMAWKEKHGSRPAATIRPKHIRDLIHDRFTTITDKDSDRCGERYSSSVKAQVEKVALGIFAWAMDEEMIDRNPVKGYKRQSTFGVRKGWITQEQFDKLLAVCGDPCFREPPTIYHFRHSWATLAPARGIDITTAAKQLGHKSLKMLMEIYDHSGDDSGDDSDFMLSKLGSA